MNTQIAAQKQYIDWIRKNDPFLWEVAKKRLQLLKTEMGDTAPQPISISSIFSNLVETVKAAAPSLLQIKQQKDIMDMQIKRAKQGLPPANVEDYTPSVKIQPVITSETEAAITRVASQTLNEGIGGIIRKYGFFVALGLGLFVFRKKLLK